MLKEKILWMVKNGFKQMFTSRETFAYSYKGYIWTENDIQKYSLDAIKKCKTYYDDKITKNELENYLKETK